MKKYVFVKTGEVVNLGDTLIKVSEDKNERRIYEAIKVNKDNIPLLIKEGAIKEQDITVSAGTHLNLDFYIEHLANRIGWKRTNLTKYLISLDTISNSAVFNILLKEIAIVLDKQYPDHIERSKNIYVISTINGQIKEVKDLTKIHNFKNFAAFRSVDDARIAKHILKPMMVEMFKKHGE